MRANNLITLISNSLHRVKSRDCEPQLFHLVTVFSATFARPKISRAQNGLLRPTHWVLRHSLKLSNTAGVKPALMPHSIPTRRFSA